ncbi:MAG: hypothetical protein IPK13_11610 [Deltaproteobacteria bacterium]|nr:hypothetical protein [Deltaproteobacteria bacterium]
MTLSARGRASLAQLLAVLDGADALVLLSKHGLSAHRSTKPGERILQHVSALAGAQPEQVLRLTEELVRTNASVRTRVSPRYKFDERFDDLSRCLMLDGYRIEENVVKPVDPTINTVPLSEDDLTVALKTLGLPKTPDIIRALDSSAEDFTKTPPDYNGSLTHARVAMEELARAIAAARAAKFPGTYDPTKWGSIIQYLRTSGLITLEEEGGLAGVYKFVSPGAHRTVGITEQEAARLGRQFCISMCYFLSKRGV